jgi:hypothetical protein
MNLAYKLKEFLDSKYFDKRKILLNAHGKIYGKKEIKYSNGNNFLSEIHLKKESGNITHIETPLSLDGFNIGDEVTIHEFGYPLFFGYLKQYHLGKSEILEEDPNFICMNTKEMVRFEWSKK